MNVFIHRWARAAASALGLIALGGVAFAQTGPLIASLADPLLGSRAQARVLQIDDQADGRCSSRQFTAAHIARMPESIHRAGRTPEVRWVEMWSLDRCGARVDYWLYFFDLGGGAYFSAQPVL
ncbi:MAG: hypothetical protein EXQ88_02635 [Alphaproteobacteria bacterium]|nr:hypothetical protein [Alphaproteobacteria bacterium]